MMRPEQETMSIFVNDTEIRDHAVQAEMPFHKAASVQAQWQEAVRALVIKTLLLDEARKTFPTENIDFSDEETVIQALLEQAVKVPTPTESELERWYASNHAQSEEPAMHIRHILIYADKSLPGSLDAAQKRAQEILEYLQGNPQDFEQFAARYSECPSASRGGDLGVVREDDLLIEFRKALKETKDGAFCSELIETRYGVHMVQLLKRFSEERTNPVRQEEEKQKIKTFLEDTSWKQGVQNYIAVLASKARIKGFDLFAGTTVQASNGNWPDGGACTGKKVQ
ncbi:peptidylprolyl isomerase [Acetobacter orleanensis]|uniref:Parvulin-like PPIase n=1 Tax=Acetobacter orleanensis TaxID=104099 RepID=A0A4Y3TQN2_9PROT|nr:peptidylprolyl isomerase [Acetobacter orleanensis]KXV66534.1 hypothetical protein AD949_02240 [Acetobacter orleanensis]GAN67758.1 peptidyl-prolyl cis-trans isomerase [Acetobacter orleanensis JCM 7639]GEB83095.1 hypothetical protein AOR01nite_15720 [Acetobacter orleanensis]